MRYALIHTRFCPAHCFLFVLCGIEKNNKTPYYFWIPSWQKLRLQPSVSTIILVTLYDFVLVVWTQLKVLGHFLVFTYTAPAKRKPTWRSKVRWLAKPAWYDVTWKPSMRVSFFLTSDYHYSKGFFFFFSVWGNRKPPSTWLPLSIWMHFSWHHPHLGFEVHTVTPIRVAIPLPENTPFRVHFEAWLTGMMSSSFYIWVS